MKKGMLAALIAGVVLTASGCSFTDGVKDGMKDAQKTESQASESESQKNVTETQKNVTESQNDVTETQKSETGNPLIDAEVHVGDVMNGTRDKKLGEYAYIEIPLEDMKNVTMEQYAEFVTQKVDNSGYNWYSIDFGNGYGLQFAGSTSLVAMYGPLDNEECIKEQIGDVMLKSEGVYEYSALE